MRVGKPAAYTHNIRLTSTAQLAANLIRTAPDPISASAQFLQLLAHGLAPSSSQASGCERPTSAAASRLAGGRASTNKLK